MLWSIGNTVCKAVCLLVRLLHNDTPMSVSVVCCSLHAKFTQSAGDEGVNYFKGRARKEYYIPPVDSPFHEAFHDGCPDTNSCAAFAGYCRGVLHDWWDREERKSNRAIKLSGQTMWDVRGADSTKRREKGYPCFLMIGGGVDERLAETSALL